MANTSSVVLVSNFYNEEYLPNCWGGAMANTSVVASLIFCVNGSITCALNCSTSS